MAYPPTSTRNAAIVCVREEPCGPMVVMFPSAPAAPYSRVTTGGSFPAEYMLSSMLYIPYCDAPLWSRRVHRMYRCMRSYKSINSEPDRKPGFSSSMNGMPVFTMLRRGVGYGITWNHRVVDKENVTSHAREWECRKGVCEEWECESW